jgi:hypothetical protein
MDRSRWMQDLIHPVTGERRVFEAGTEEELEKKIAEWVAADAEVAGEQRTPPVDRAHSPR